MNHILYEIFKIILSISSKKHEVVSDYPPIIIYVNKIINKITFRVRTGYYHLKQCNYLELVKVR